MDRTTIRLKQAAANNKALYPGMNYLIRPANPNGGGRFATG